MPLDPQDLRDLREQLKRIEKQVEGLIAQVEQEARVLTTTGYAAGRPTRTV